MAGSIPACAMGETRSSLTPAGLAWRRFRRNRPAVLAAGFLLLAGLALGLGPLVLPYAPDAFVGTPFSAPSAAHWWGTDVHGRDLLARVLAGARLSLLIGTLGTMVSLVIGVAWGAVAGYAGGRTDAILMRTVDILYSLPTVIIVIVVVTGLNGWLARSETAGGGRPDAAVVRLAGLFIGLGVVSWPTMARIVRGEVLTLRVQPFVEASRSLGAGPVWILWRHILPNIAGVVIAYLALTMPGIVIYESFLSFLGLGLQPPQASLGSLIAEGAAGINPIRIYWWLVVFPAGTLASLLLALNFLGDGLRDVGDPRAPR